MAADKQNYLVLIAKSLTQNRKDKNYIISIENHNINDKINIQNTFAHNYEYIYKLWPCQPATRELLKITMFEKVVCGGNTEIIKRGEASPLVKYSNQGERFQFYGSFDQKCVIVLKFKVQTKQSIEDDVNNGQLQRINKNLQRQLRINKEQSLNYKHYLDYTNRLIQTLNFEPLAQKKYSLKENEQIGKLPGSIVKKSKNPKYSETSVEQVDQTVKKPQKVGCLYSPKTKQKIYSKQMYLNSTLDHDSVNLNQSRTDSSSHKKECKNDEQINYSSLNNDDSIKQTKRFQVSSEIKKRRQRYFDNKIVPIIERPSKQPLDSFEDDNINQQNSEKPVLRTIQEPGKPSQFNQSFGKVQYCFLKNKSIEIAEGKKFGSIRRKKATASLSKSGIQPVVEQQLSKKSSNKNFEPNDINHSSFHHKTIDSTQTTNYNLNLFNFKAVLYAGNKSFPKKLGIIFQERIYSTQVNNCVNLSTEWNQRFGIKNCSQNSIINFALISVGKKQKGEGESQVVANDIINCSSRLYRSYFFVDDLAVGYLEFEFQVTQASSKEFVQKTKFRRNTISLPQLIKKNESERYPKRRSSLNNKDEQCQSFQKAKRITSDKQYTVKKSLGNGRYLQIHQNKQKVMNKIKEKKMLLRAKLK